MRKWIIYVIVTICIISQIVIGASPMNFLTLGQAKQFFCQFDGTNCYYGNVSYNNGTFNELYVNNLITLGGDDINDLFVPYTGATDDVDLGSHTLDTTGKATFGELECVVGDTVLADLIFSAGDRTLTTSGAYSLTLSTDGGDFGTEDLSIYTGNSTASSSGEINIFTGKGLTSGDVNIGTGDKTVGTKGKINLLANTTVSGMLETEYLNVTNNLTTVYATVTNLTIGTGKIWYNGSGMCIGKC